MQQQTGKNKLLYFLQCFYHVSVEMVIWKLKGNVKLKNLSLESGIFWTSCRWIMSLIWNAVALLESWFVCAAGVLNRALTGVWRGKSHMCPKVTFLWITSALTTSNQNMVFEQQTLSGPGELTTMSPGCLPVYLCLSFMVSLMKTGEAGEGQFGTGRGGIHVSIPGSVRSSQGSTDWVWTAGCPCSSVASTWSQTWSKATFKRIAQVWARNSLSA